MSPDNNSKKEASRKKKSKSSISSAPSTVIDERSTSTSAASKTRRSSDAKRSSKSSRVGSHKSGLSVRSTAASKASTSNVRINIKQSRIMNSTNGRAAPRSRARVNPLTLKVRNRNVPEEASAPEYSTILCTSGDILDPVNVYNDDVREEFQSKNIKQLSGTDLDPERFLKPSSHPTDSYLDRHVDPSKLIDFMVKHMLSYYDLSKDHDAYSRPRQMMDDVLWDSLAYIIPMLCRQVIDLLRKESMVVSVEPDALVFGDLHGNFNDVYFIYQHFITNEKYAHHRFVFLGDYVDRGPKPVEIVSFLFANKLAHPDRFILLRGNHEVLKVNRKYGFQATCSHIFQDSYVKHPILSDLIYKSFNRAFCYLPVGAVIKGRPGHRIFCCHGGVPSQYLKPEAAQSTGWTIEELNALMMKPVVLSPSKGAKPQELTLNEVLWNDPTPEKVRDKRRFKHRLFFRNKKRGGHCSFFTEDGLRAFLEANQLAMVIRGHQYRHCKKGGYKRDFGNKLLTVFSSSNYCGTERNDTGYAHVTGQDCVVTPNTLRTIEEASKYSNFNVFKLIVDDHTKEISVAF